MGFVFWCASYSGRKIEWRGDWYRLEGGGRMVLVERWYSQRSCRGGGAFACRGGRASSYI